MQISELDTARFGINIAKVHVDDLTLNMHLLTEAAANGIKLLITRTPTSALSTVHFLEEHGARLCDTLLVSNLPLPMTSKDRVPDGYSIKKVGRSDNVALGSLAFKAFSSYQSHYHSDPKLDPEKVSDLYRDWAKKIASGIAADIAFQVRKGDDLVGFASIRKIDAATCDFPLVCISENEQGAGLFKPLILECAAWASASGYTCVEYATQITNVRAQRAIAKLGFRPTRSYYTHHVWLE